jgi:hypothetical protein
MTMNYRTACAIAETLIEGMCALAVVCCIALWAGYFTGQI